MDRKTAERQKKLEAGREKLAKFQKRKNKLKVNGHQDESSPNSSLNSSHMEETDSVSPHRTSLELGGECLQEEPRDPSPDLSCVDVVAKYQGKILEYARAVEQRDAAIKRLSDRLSAELRNRSEAQDRDQHLAQEISALKSQLHQATEILNQYHSQGGIPLEEVLAVRSENQQLRDLIWGLLQKLGNGHHHPANSQAAGEILSQHLNSLLLQLQEHRDCQSRIDGLECELSTKSSHLVNLQSLLETLEQEKTESLSQQECFKQSLDDAQCEKSRLEGHLYSTEQERQDLEGAIARLQQENEELQRLWKSTTDQQQALQEEGMLTKELLSNAQKENLELQQLCQQYEADCANFTLRIHQMEDLEARLKESNAEAVSELHSKELSIMGLQDEIGSLNARFERKLADLQEQHRLELEEIKEKLTIDHQGHLQEQAQAMSEKYGQELENICQKLSQKHEADVCELRQRLEEDHSRKMLALEEHMVGDREAELSRHIQSLEERHEQEVAGLVTHHEQEVLQLRQEGSRRLAEEREAAAASCAQSLQSQHQGELEELRVQQEAELDRVKQQMAAEHGMQLEARILELNTRHSQLMEQVSRSLEDKYAAQVSLLRQECIEKHQLEAEEKESFHQKEQEQLIEQMVELKRQLCLCQDQLATLAQEKLQAEAKLQELMNKSRASIYVQCNLASTQETCINTDLSFNEDSNQKFIALEETRYLELEDLCRKYQQEACEFKSKFEANAKVLNKSSQKISSLKTDYSLEIEALNSNIKLLTKKNTKLGKLLLEKEDQLQKALAGKSKETIGRQALSENHYLAAPAEAEMIRNQLEEKYRAKISSLCSEQVAKVKELMNRHSSELNALKLSYGTEREKLVEDHNRAIQKLGDNLRQAELELSAKKDEAAAQIEELREKIRSLQVEEEMKRKELVEEHQERLLALQQKAEEEQTLLFKEFEVYKNNTDLEIASLKRELQQSLDQAHLNAQLESLEQSKLDIQKELTSLLEQKQEMARALGAMGTEKLELEKQIEALRDTKAEVSKAFENLNSSKSKLEDLVSCLTEQVSASQQDLMDLEVRGESAKLELESLQKEKSEFQQRIEVLKRSAGQEPLAEQRHVLEEQLQLLTTSSGKWLWAHFNQGIAELKKTYLENTQRLLQNLREMKEPPPSELQAVCQALETNIQDVERTSEHLLERLAVSSPDALCPAAASQPSPDTTTDHGTSMNNQLVERGTQADCLQPLKSFQDMFQRQVEGMEQHWSQLSHATSHLEEKVHRLEEAKRMLEDKICRKPITNSDRSSETQSEIQSWQLEVAAQTNCRLLHVLSDLVKTFLDMEAEIKVQLHRLGLESPSDIPEEEAGSREDLLPDSLEMSEDGPDLVTRDCFAGLPTPDMDVGEDVVLGASHRLRKAVGRVLTLLGSALEGSVELVVLLRKWEELSQQLQEENSARAALHSELLLSQGQVRNLESQLTQLSEEAQERNELLDFNQRQLSRLENERQALAEDLASLTGSLLPREQELVEEAGRLRRDKAQQAANHQTELKSLKEKIQLQEAALEQRDQEIANLSAQLEALERNLQADRRFLEEQTHEREQEREEYVRLAAQLGEVVREKDKVQAREARLDKEVQVLEERLQCSSRDLAQAGQHNSRLESQLSRAMEEVKDLKEAAQGLEAELEAANQREGQAVEEMKGLRAAASLAQAAGVRRQEQEAGHNSTASDSSINPDHIEMLEDQLFARQQDLDKLLQLQQHFLELRSQLHSLEGRLDTYLQSVFPEESILPQEGPRSDAPSPSSLYWEEFHRVEAKLARVLQHSAVLQDQQSEWALTRDVLQDQVSCQLVEISTLKTRLQEQRHRQLDTAQLEQMVVAERHQTHHLQFKLQELQEELARVSTTTLEENHAVAEAAVQTETADKTDAAIMTSENGEESEILELLLEYKNEEIESLQAQEMELRHQLDSATAQLEKLQAERAEQLAHMEQLTSHQKGELARVLALMEQELTGIETTRAQPMAPQSGEPSALSPTEDLHPELSSGDLSPVKEKPSIAVPQLEAKIRSLEEERERHLQEIDKFQTLAGSSHFSGPGEFLECSRDREQELGALREETEQQLLLEKQVAALEEEKRLAHETHCREVTALRHQLEELSANHAAAQEALRKEVMSLRREKSDILDLLLQDKQGEEAAPFLTTSCPDLKRELLELKERHASQVERKIRAVLAMAKEKFKLQKAHLVGQLAKEKEELVAQNLRALSRLKQQADCAQETLETAHLAELASLRETLELEKAKLVKTHEENLQKVNESFRHTLENQRKSLEDKFLRQFLAFKKSHVVETAGADASKEVESRAAQTLEDVVVEDKAQRQEHWHRLARELEDHYEEQLRQVKEKLAQEFVRRHAELEASYKEKLEATGRLNAELLQESSSHAEARLRKEEWRKLQEEMERKIAQLEAQLVVKEEAIQNLSSLMESGLEDASDVSSTASLPSNLSHLLERVYCEGKQVLSLTTRAPAWSSEHARLLEEVASLRAQLQSAAIGQSGDARAESWQRKLQEAWQSEKQAAERLCNQLEAERKHTLELASELEEEKSHSHQLESQLYRLRLELVQAQHQLRSPQTSASSANSSPRHHPNPTIGPREENKLPSRPDLALRLRKLESHRKALAYQKKYLLALLGGFQATERAAAALLCPPGMPPPTLGPLAKFRAAGHALVALSRLRLLRLRWLPQEKGAAANF